MRPEMMTNMTKLLGRIDEIVAKCHPDYRAAAEPAPRFVDVLDDVRKAGKAGRERDPRDPEALQETIEHCADIYNIDEELIRAMIQVESGWNQKAVSSKGAQGLMQLMPRTAKMLGVDDPFDPHQNIEGGVKYISDLTDKYDGDIEKALAAYNAGPSRIDAGGMPSETSRYVRNVMALYYRYREED
ncbi:MAG: lytic transglycosylase domain-containing protein [Fretibacterium sp.]|nr:lytic transglycosylase domain-containing protein [Fretibacterium sp.]